ncbi:hypothetical protein [Breznakiella homolactica]|uniref:Uncharacterized protein n=1 Tax=Breznakiella homolactica TaxID=2798577 RepID=A0A7T7XM57_9SPIR|nr:hypothetical protein [Breznakiella homolactica]QQO08846.1 hypothetical protein JFL75_18240 [Breznakiella homolactica]
MKILDTEAYGEIAGWIHRNARELELSLWRYFFEEGSREAVLSALEPYRNHDGGFGHAMEPDNWNPGSTPNTCLYALHILGAIGFWDPDSPLCGGILSFLEEAEQPGGGWLFSVPENDRYPRAPWWNYSEKENTAQGPGLTAEISGIILRYGDRESELFRRALSSAEIFFADYAQADPQGEMGLSGALSLIKAIEERNLPVSFDYASLKERIPALINKTIERDPSKWQYYTPRPSLFIDSPESPFYPGNEEIVAAELDYLIETRHPGGVWDISWTWFDNLEKYSREFCLSENWWKASKATEKLLFLKNFGRLEK